MMTNNIQSSVRRYKIADQVYDILRAQIIKGILVPGQEILVDQLAGRLDSSKTPIREALNRLKGEGLIIGTDKGKMSVIKLSSKEITHICELRVALEMLALRWSFENIPREKLQENLRMLREAEEKLKRGDPTHFYEVDTILHNLIVNSAGNQWLSQIISQLRNLIEITRNMFTSIERDKESLREHIIIIESLLKGDKEVAMKNLNSHIEHVKSHLLCQILHQEEEISENLVKKTK